MTRTTGILASVSLALVACAAVTVYAQENGHFRSAWNKRSAENTTVHNLAVGTLTWWTVDAGRRMPREAELRIEAKLQCEERKVRVDVTDSRGGGNLYILDGREFHTCVRLPAEAWRVLSARQLSGDSDWLLFYPFLLARGFVPLPPLGVPPSRDALANDQLWREQSGPRDGETTFTFEGKPTLTVTIGHDNNGLITNYLVTGDNRSLLEINNTYRRDRGTERLDRLTVTRYAPDGQPARRFDAQVTQCRTGAPMAADLFVPPRGKDQLGDEFSGLLDQKLKVDVQMSLDDIERSLQAAFGRDITVQLDKEAFAGDHEVKTDRLMFEPGEATLSEFLLRDLPRNRLDFYFDQDAVVIIPRSRAWSRAQEVGYSPADYDLTIGELQDLIYEAGKHGDWSDVGGVATIVANEEEGRLNVFHTQSDHLCFMQRLAELGSADED